MKGYTPDGLLTLEEKKHDVGIDPHIIAPDPYACHYLNVSFSDCPPSQTISIFDTMNSGDEESSPSLNVRLRPRKPPNTSQNPKVTSRKQEDKHVMPQATTNPKKDLVDQAEPPLSLQYFCIYCEKKFASKQAISKHVRRIHFSSNQKQNPLTKCIFCSYSDGNLNNIIQHMLNNHPDDYFVCLECHTRLPSELELKNHKLNTCENKKNTSALKTPQRKNTTTKRNKKTAKNEADMEIEERNDFAGIVISCELKPPQVRDEEDIEDNITTNVILPRTKPLNNSAIAERSGVIIFDDLQWGRRISQGLSFHNTDADQILSRLGVVHRSPRTGESTKKEGKAIYDEPTQKFEKCFDTNFYSKVASNVQENLTKYLDGSFNFKPDPDSVVTTRRSKYSVTINTVEGFPILLACEQYSRNAFDGYIPRASALKHKWKWGNVEFEKSLLSPIHLNRDSHSNNCIITLVSSLDIWTQLRMRKKFDEINNRSAKEKVNEKQNNLGNELKEILESREISKPKQVVPYQNRQIPKDDKVDFSASLGLVPSSPRYNVEPAVLSGEWVRPRCYVCCACGTQTYDSRTLTSHIATTHPNAQVQHYEIVGELLLNSDILKHLYVPPSPVSNRTRPLRGFKECTKCNKSISLEDLHQHMLDCAGDTPTVRRKQCRYRLFGVRKRRPRLPDNTVRKKIRKHIRNRQKRQKTRMRPRQRIRSEVGDAETIRKMIADLPAKRQRVMVNPHQISKPRRHIDRKRNKLAVKQRLAGESSKIKEARKKNENNSPDAKASLKSKLVRVISTRQNSAIINRKVALTRLKKKSNQAKEQRDIIENEVLSTDSKSANKSLSIDGQSPTNFVNDASFSVKEHGNKNGSTSQNQQNSSFEGGQNNSNNAHMPSQNTPLKHSIAQLTANSERHDKSVQFHHLFLVQQECNDINQSVEQYDHKNEPQNFFENKETVTKPDKPPINTYNNESGENRNNKLKQNKPRKRLNDCIAMLKNKLTDVSQTGLVSVKCGSDEPLDEPLEPELKINHDAGQNNGKNSYLISNWTFNETTTNVLPSVDSKSRPQFDDNYRINSSDAAVNFNKNVVTQYNNFAEEHTINREKSNQSCDVLIHNASTSQSQINPVLISHTHQDLTRLNIKLVEQDFSSKQTENTSQLTSKPAEVLKVPSSTPNINSSIPKHVLKNKKQYDIENLIETCPVQESHNDSYNFKSKEINIIAEKENSSINVQPRSNLELLNTEIPIAHASTKAESIIMTPLDLSLKVYPSAQIYSMLNNEVYETLDLSNKNCVPMSPEPNISEYIVDLSVKSTYKQDSRNESLKSYEQESTPTDLSSKAKKIRTNNTVEIFATKNTTKLNIIAENQSHTNAHDMSYVPYGEPQEEINCMTGRLTNRATDMSELNSHFYPTDYCLTNRADRNVHDLVCPIASSNLERNSSGVTIEQQFLNQNYENTSVIGIMPPSSEESSSMKNVSSKTSLTTSNHHQKDKPLEENTCNQQGSSTNMTEQNISTPIFASTLKTSATVGNKMSKDKLPMVSDETYNTLSESNVSSNHNRSSLSQDYTSAQTSYSGSTSQLNSIKLLIEEEHNKQKYNRKENADDNSEIASKIAMLPKELVEVLGKMPTDHRNQLMEILKQYISSATSSGVSQYEAARNYMSTAGLMPDNNMQMLTKQQAGDNTVTTSDPQTLNQPISSPNIIEFKANCITVSDKNSDLGQFDSNLSKTPGLSMNNDGVVDLTEDENRANVKLPETYLSGDCCPTEKTVKQRVYSDQTASLRAVRIKAPSERRRENQLNDKKVELKVADSSELENSESTNEFLAIQQAEISSTQHGVKNIVSESPICVSNEHVLSLEHSSENTPNLNDKSCFDSQTANVKVPVVTSSVTSVQVEKKELNPNPIAETNELLQNIKTPNHDFSPTKCEDYAVGNNKSKIANDMLDSKKSVIKNNVTEDDSEDDISLALIVKQKQNRSKSVESKLQRNISPVKKNKRKMKKVNKHSAKQPPQRHPTKLLQEPSIIPDSSKNEEGDTLRNMNIYGDKLNPCTLKKDANECNIDIKKNYESKKVGDITKGKEKIQYKRTTETTIKNKNENKKAKTENGTQKVLADTFVAFTPPKALENNMEQTFILPANTDKSFERVDETVPLSVTVSQTAINITQNLPDSEKEPVYPDESNKSNKKSQRIKKSNISTNLKKNLTFEESVPLRRSRRGKSLMFDEFDKNRPDTLESKPLLTKKQLIFSKLLLDNEVLQNTDISYNEKILECSDHKNAKHTLNKNIEDITTDNQREIQTETLEILFNSNDKVSDNSLLHIDQSQGDVPKSTADEDVPDNASSKSVCADSEYIDLKTKLETINVASQRTIGKESILSANFDSSGGLTKLLTDEAPLPSKNSASFILRHAVDDNLNVSKAANKSLNDAVKLMDKHENISKSLNLSYNNNPKSTIHEKLNLQFVKLSSSASTSKTEISKLPQNLKSADVFSKDSMVELSSLSPPATSSTAVPKQIFDEQSSPTSRLQFADVTSKRTSKDEVIQPCPSVESQIDLSKCAIEEKSNIQRCAVSVDDNFRLSNIEDTSSKSNCNNDVCLNDSKSVKSNNAIEKYEGKLSKRTTVNLTNENGCTSSTDEQLTSVLSLKNETDSLKDTNDKSKLTSPENNVNNKTTCFELTRHVLYDSSKHLFEKTEISMQENSKLENNVEPDTLKVSRFAAKKKRSTEKKLIQDDTDLDVPIAARRARSKSVIVKTSYDPYDIEMDNMDDETQPLTSLLKEKRKSTIALSNRKDYKTDTAVCITVENETAVENETRTKKKSGSCTSVPVKSRLKPAKKVIGNKLIKEDKKRKIYEDNEECAIHSDDSTKSDVPLLKYVKEKKVGDTNKRSQKIIENSKSKVVKIINDNQDNESENKKNESSLESEEQLRSEQFMESFGFFSQRKPRKSNLLASKKIAETFHSISVESDDTSDTPKSKVTKKLQSNEENKKTKRGRKKKEQVAMTTCYCMICKKEFRRPDNYVRHQMTLLHVSKLCEVELDIKTPPIIEETNYLIIYKNELDKIKKKAEEDKRLNKEVVIPSLEEILVQVHKTVRAQQLSRRGLSRDEALFLDCCELLKKSHKHDVREKEARSLIKNFDNVELPHCSIASYHDNEEKDSRSDGDVDSITAKNILESEEVRNLENDLISGLKEAAEMHSRKDLSVDIPTSLPETSDGTVPQKYSLSSTAFNQSHKSVFKDLEASTKIDRPKSLFNENSNSSITSNLGNESGEKNEFNKSIPIESKISQDKKEIKNLKKDKIIIDETTNTISEPEPSKIKKSNEVKDKMYPDLENIDIFEDKFDKIKRKCRSQAAAARQTQMTIETTSRKERKRPDKSKLRKTSKKNQQNTILTKGALKGFDHIKESIPSSDCNTSTEVHDENYHKKKRKSSSKKKRDKKAFKDEQHDTKINASTSAQKKIDVYEFMDNDDAELFEFRPSTLMERFKNISSKETLNKGVQKPDAADEKDGFTSESGSDGDDFVYMSDDYLVGSDNETENSVISCETENGTEERRSVQRKRDITEKKAVMGRIFKNNAVRGEKRLAKYRESAKHKANLDKLFDSLLSEEPTSLHNDDNDNEKEKPSQSSSDTRVTAKTSQYDDFSPPKEVTVRKRKRSSEYTEKDFDLILPKKSNVTSSKTYDKNNYDIKVKLPTDAENCSDENKDYAHDNYNYFGEHGVAPQRARRKCTVGKQNVLAETWSSESEPDGVPSRPNSVESDATVVGRKRKVKKKDIHASSSRRNKQQASAKKHDYESRLHKNNRIRPTSSAKTRVSIVNETKEREVVNETFPDDPYHMPTPSTSGFDGSSKGRSRTSSYYWSGDGEDEQEHQQQHGWIVGDSHKKLVTMLAHAKGRKRNNDNSLIE